MNLTGVIASFLLISAIFAIISFALPFLLTFSAFVLSVIVILGGLFLLVVLFSAIKDKLFPPRDINEARREVLAILRKLEAPIEEDAVSEIGKPDEIYIPEDDSDVKNMTGEELLAELERLGDDIENSDDSIKSKKDKYADEDDSECSFPF